jgi:hypothetical protein
MKDETFHVIQFVHPGFEYSRGKVGGGSSGVMGWKPGRSPHNRKFMLCNGSLIDWTEKRDHRDAPLTFWGEWEGPSVYWRVESAGKPLPSIIHAPFRPGDRPSTSVQNTDPMVFGESFIYSNCLQRTYRRLRALPHGSLVLFGRNGRKASLPFFSLDTCLVVHRADAMLPIDSAKYGTDLLYDAVLGPLQTEGAEIELAVYFGKKFTGVKDGPFSFFPAQLAVDSMPLFARPELRPVGALEGIVSPGNMQGIKATTVTSTDERDAIWSEVVRQVSKQGCQLGYVASPPPLLKAPEADSHAGRGPHPLA